MQYSPMAPVSTPHHRHSKQPKWSRGALDGITEHGSERVDRGAVRRQQHSITLNAPHDHTGADECVIVDIDGQWLVGGRASVDQSFSFVAEPPRTSGRKMVSTISSMSRSVTGCSVIKTSCRNRSIGSRAIRALI